MADPPKPAKPAPYDAYTGDLGNYGPPTKGFNSQEIGDRRRVQAIVGRAFAGVPSTPDLSQLTPAIRQAIASGVSDDAIVQKLRSALHLDTAATLAQTKPSANAGMLEQLGKIGQPSATTPPPGVAPTGQPSAVDLHGSIVDEILASRPKATDFTTVDGVATSGMYTDLTQSAAQQKWLAAASDAIKVQDLLDAEHLGVVKLPNGQMFYKGDFNKLTPQEQQQIGPLFEQQSIDAQNAYSDQLNKYGLSQFNSAVSAANLNNEAASKGFQAKLDVLDRNLALGKVDQDTALAEIDRQLKGMTESRSRAKFVDDALAEADKTATGGRTQFTGADLGGGVAGLARAAGIPEGAPLLSFTGTRTVDPQGQLNWQDQQLGVTGQLPKLPHYVQLPPGFSVTPSDIPSAPGFSGAPALPSLRMPLPPAAMFVPRPSTPAAGYPGSAAMVAGDYE